MTHAGPVQMSVFVKIDRPLVAEQVWPAGQEFRLPDLSQTPDGHAPDLRVGMVEARVDRTPDGVELLADQRTQPPDGPKDSGPKMDEVLWGHLSNQ